MASSFEENGEPRSRDADGKAAAWRRRLAIRRELTSGQERPQNRPVGTALRIAREHTGNLLRGRKRHGTVWGTIARHTVYVFKNTSAIAAYAVRMADYNAIVMTSGLLSVLEQAAPILALLERSVRNEPQEPSFRQEIAELIAAIRTGRTDAEAVRRKTEELYSRLPPDPLEKSGKLAGAYLDFMICFVLEHEWAHITQGHLELEDLLYADNGRSILAGTFWEGTGNLLRTLEISADTQALVNTLEMRAKRLAAWALGDSANPDPSTYDFAISVAFPIAFILDLDDLKPTQLERMRWSAHPPGFYRFFSMADYMSYWVLGGFPAEGPGNPEAVRISNDWTKQLGYYARWMNGGLIDLDPEGRYFIPSAERFVKYKLDHAFGLSRWPLIKEACKAALISRVVGSHAAAQGSPGD